MRLGATLGSYPHLCYGAARKFTDGRRLFRCLPASEGSMLMLEDCSTLELMLCETDELLQADLRLVRPGVSPEPDLRYQAPVVAT